MRTGNRHRGSSPSDRTALGLAGIAGIAGIAVLTGCAVTGPVRHATRTDLPFPSALAAWAVADVCRGEYPGADPLPRHADAPVLHHGAGRFEVRLARAQSDSVFRVAMNGRLPAPRIARRGARVALPTPVFRPAPGFTGCRAGATDSVAVEIEPRPGGCRVTLELCGEPATGRLEDHLHRVLDLLAACQTSGELVARGEWITADRYLETLDDSRLGTCCARHQKLRAVIHAHRATVYERRSELSPARIALSSAVSADPRDPILRARLAALDERIARQSDARRHWQQLAADPRVGPLVRTTAARRGRGEPAAEFESASCCDRADELLANADVLGALTWARRALAAEPRSERAERTWIETLRARGLYREAFATGLMRLQDGEFDAGMLLGLARDTIEFGEPVVGLRLVARFWDRLEAAAPQEAGSTLDALIAGSGERLASRVLLAERNNALGQTRLRNWRDTDPTGARMLRRLTALRSRDVEVPAAPAVEVDRPYDDAPGVAPLR